MKTLLTVIFSLFAFTCSASGKTELMHANIDLSDNTSLKRGAEHYVTYCLGCHSAKHIRYLRIAEDLELNQDVVLKDIAPVGASIYDSMLSAMDKHDSKIWFGTVPPDLSLIARSRGSDWLYTYLKSFYRDDSKPLVTNNALFKDVGMPNVLWKLQGEQVAHYTQNGDKKVISSLNLQRPGELNPNEFDRVVTDLVNFLEYVGEPAKLKRQQMGKYVLLFILIIGFIGYLLKKEYWKDIH